MPGADSGDGTPNGGESGIRTHGTVKYHWFSRPAP